MYHPPFPLGLWKGTFTFAITEYKISSLSILEDMRRIHHKSVLKYFGKVSRPTEGQLAGNAKAIDLNTMLLQIPTIPQKICWEYLDGGYLSNYLNRNTLEISDIIDITTQVRMFNKIRLSCQHTIENIL